MAVSLELRGGCEGAPLWNSQLWCTRFPLCEILNTSLSPNRYSNGYSQYSTYIIYSWHRNVIISYLWCIHNLLRGRTSNTNNNLWKFVNPGRLAEYCILFSPSTCCQQDLKYLWNSQELFINQCWFRCFPVPVWYTDRSSSFHRWRSSWGWPRSSNIGVGRSHYCRIRECLLKALPIHFKFPTIPRYSTPSYSTGFATYHHYAGCTRTCGKRKKKEKQSWSLSLSLVYPV